LISGVSAERRFSRGPWSGGADSPPSLTGPTALAAKAVHVAAQRRLHLRVGHLTLLARRGAIRQ